MTAECHRCGGSPDHVDGNSYLCDECKRHLESGGADDENEAPAHENPIDVSDVTDEERAQMLHEYLEAFVDEFGQVPRLMPLNDKGKAPIIQGRCRLDSPEGRSYLVDGDDAIRQIRENGARGFALYAGKRDHGTEDALFVDHDDDAFSTPTGDPTLEVLAGSGRGTHETYRNAGDVQNARVGDNLGEIRAENWYVVTPGSIHPTGGVYHVHEERDVTTLADEDLDDSMRPASGQRDRDGSGSSVQDLDGEGDRPDDDVIDERLERAFANSHDGDRIQKVWNGRYRAAGFDDRSAAEFWLANRLDSWVGRGNSGTVRQLMDRANLQKWPERPDDSYRDSVLSEVGHQDWYYDPNYEGENDGADHTAVLPETDELNTATSGWDWRTAGSSSSTLSIDDARERTVDAIADAYEHSDQVLVEALPTMGKSYGSIKAAADTGEQVTILTGRGREEQYEQVKEWSAEHDLSYYTLPSFTRDCDTANGEHGQKWAETVQDWYRRGATPKQIHKSAEYVLNRPLPCQEHEGEQCPYASKWDFDPDDYDVLIGHYTHAYKSKVMSGRTAVIDEFPSAYEAALGPELQGAVSYWLDTTDGVPFSDYTDLVENRDDQQRRADALLWFEEHDIEPDETHVFDDGSAHADAPLAVFTLLAGEDLGNGFEKADLGDVGTGVFNRETGQIYILRSPELKYTSGVVALDGTPTKQMWELSLGERLNHRPVLQPEERAEYIEEALNLNLVPTTEAVKPYNNADHVNTGQDAALLESIAESHGQRPAVITTSTAEHEYDAAGVLEYADGTKHYGNVLGSNEFKETRLGAVIGSNHYGDGYIKKWGAYAGETVERNGEKGAELSYGDFGDRILSHMREHDTLQAAMRFGRDGNGAVVYVHTDTLPDWVPLAGEGRVVTTWSDGMKGVVEALKDFGRATAAEIVEHPAVDVDRRQVAKHLETLRERDVLSRRRDPEDGRRFLWQDDGLHTVGEHGDVDLGATDLDELTEEEVLELTRTTTYTWEFQHSPHSSDTKPVSGNSSSARIGSPTENVGDPPPHESD